MPAACHGFRASSCVVVSLLVQAACCAISHGSTITDPGVIIIDWLPVGNPGNAADTVLAAAQAGLTHFKPT